MSQGEDSEKAVNGPKISISGMHTKDFAFGVQHPMFAASKRWNRIAITGRRDNEATDEESSEFKKEFNRFATSLADRYASLAYNGNPVFEKNLQESPGKMAGSRCRLYDSKGRFIGVYQYRGNGRYHLEKMFLDPDELKIQGERAE